MDKGKKFINGKTIFGAVIVVLLIVVIAILVFMNNRVTYNDDYFKSDDTKIVLLLENNPDDDEKNPIKTYMVYYYSGENITSVKQFYQFKSDEVAKNMMEETKNLQMDWVKDIALNGPYIIFELTEDQYEGFTTTSVRESIKSSDAADQENDTSTDDDVVENTEDVSE